MDGRCSNWGRRHLKSKTASLCPHNRGGGCEASMGYTHFTGCRDTHVLAAEPFSNHRQPCTAQTAGALPSSARREPALLPPPHLTLLCVAATKGAGWHCSWGGNRRLLGSGSRCHHAVLGSQVRPGSSAVLQGFSANITAPAGTGCWR